MTQAAATSLQFPLLSRHLFNADRISVAQTTITIDPVRDPFLYDHCFKGHPLLPAVMMMEMAAELASACANGRRVTGIQGLRCLNGLRFFQPTQQDVTVRCAVLGDAALCRLSYDFRNRKGLLVEADRPCAELVVRFQESSEEDAEYREPAGSVARNWKDLRYSDSRDSYLGPSMRGLQRVALDADGLWGEIIAPDASQMLGDRGIAGLQLPVALIDACLVAGVLYAQHEFGVSVALPLGLQSLQLHRMPQSGERCQVRIRRVARSENQFTLDFRLEDANGGSLATGRDFIAGKVGSNLQPVAELTESAITGPPRQPR